MRRFGVALKITLAWMFGNLLWGLVSPGIGLIATAIAGWKSDVPKPWLYLLLAGVFLMVTPIVSLGARAIAGHYFPDWPFSAPLRPVASAVVVEAAKPAPHPVPVAPVDPKEVFERITEMASQQARRTNSGVIEGLIRDGLRLRLIEQRIEQGPDEETRRFDPMAAGMHQITQQTKYMFGPPQEVKTWLQRVWRTVTADHVEYSDQIVQRTRGGSVTHAEVTALIDQNLAVLRAIKADLEK